MHEALKKIPSKLGGPTPMKWPKTTQLLVGEFKGKPKKSKDTQPQKIINLAQKRISETTPIKFKVSPKRNYIHIELK